MKPKVSIVIVCMNRPDLLFPCLDGIREHTSVDYETLVVAYLFSPENLAMLRERYPWITVVESNETRGFSENNNLALRIARGEYCYILNDDTVMEEPVIDRLLEDFARLPENTAVVAPRLVLEDGSTQYAGRDIPSPWQYLLDISGLHRTQVRHATELSQTGCLSGAAFLIKTDVFRDIEWFDERYFFTPEDMAVSKALRDKGYSLYVDPDISVTHKWRRSSSPIMAAIRPANVRGHMIMYFGGSGLRCTLFGVAVAVIFGVKWISALLRGNQLEARTFRNVVRTAFSRRTPKELFVRFCC